MAVENPKIEPAAPDEFVEPAGKEMADDIYTASQWQLMAMKFRKHKLAVVAGFLIITLYLVAFSCEFFAPYPQAKRDIDFSFAPPQRLHFISDEGFHLRPFVYGLNGTRDPETRRKIYVEDRSVQRPLRFFVRGEPYKLFGFIPTDRHLFGVDEGPIYLLGADSMGRDLFSRIVYGARISLTIGLVGVATSFVLGLVFGAVSGFYGGTIDNIIQRMIEIVLSFPTIPLWMALAAALPRSWSPLQVYFGITIVLSFRGWAPLARQVRGKLLSLREEDFAMAALLSGASEWRIMWRHLLPSFMSHIIVSLTLAVPAMILAETALSFLGLGLRPPTTSWGVLLVEAQNVQAVANHPWLLTPVVFIILAVLAFNFVGDGLRDAADPYSR